MPGASPDRLRGSARRWARALAGIGFVPLTGAEVENRLAVLLERLVQLLVAEPYQPADAEPVGAQLVAANFTDAVALRRSLALLAEELPQLCADRPAPAAGWPERIGALQAAFATGYARALRFRTMTEQEQLSRSILDALRASEARFRAVFGGSATGIAVADATGRIIDANRAFAEMLGYGMDELHREGVLHQLIGDPAAGPGAQELVDGTVDHLRTERSLQRKDGTSIRVDLIASLIRDDAGAAAYTVSVLTDITERYELQERLRQQALHDELTGLGNRRLFAERLEAAFADAGAGRIGLCCLDLDRFKYVNDSHGHEVGDQVLVVVADRLRRYAATYGYLTARMGGDEFVVLVCPSSGAGHLAAVARDLIDTVAEPVVVGPHRVTVSASVGVVEQPVADTTPAEITTAGDITLQWAKNDGRGRWATFDPDRYGRHLARYRLAASMAEAIDNSEFALVYQPLVRLHDGRIQGVEALVRWCHPRLGVVPPDQFIGLAEETGLIVPLGRWILREACTQASRWGAARGGAGVFVSVNLAVPQLTEPDLTEQVGAVLAETGLAPELLQLELTESAVMTTDGRPLATLRQLAAMGVRIAIDDFGTGYSNLAYLRNLPVHALKLAGTFIENLRDADVRHHTDEQIVDKLIRLAHAIGLTVTAEAVETAAQADLLRDFDCDLAQGWHVGLPMPAEQISALLADPGGGPG